MDTIKREVVLDFPIGYNVKNKCRRLHFNDFNAIVLAGTSGSGKSQSLSYWTSCLVYKGVQIIPCEYDAAQGIADSFYSRIEHLEPAFLQPFATTSHEIMDRVKYVEDLVVYRRTHPYTFCFPVLFILDEFSSLYIGGGTGYKLPLDRLLNLINTARKYNIRFILAGQTWGQINSNNIAQIRESCDKKIVHHIESRNLNLLIGSSVEEERLVRRLKVGYIYYNGEVLYVQSYMDHDMKQKAYTEALHYSSWYKKTAHLSKDELLRYLIERETFALDPREIAIRDMLIADITTSARTIYKYVGGNSHDTHTLIRRIRHELQGKGYKMV